MDTMDIYNQFRDFWTLFRPAEKFDNRQKCSRMLWATRSAQAREAMLQHLKTQGAPPNKNPYFWIQEFPEPGLEPIRRTTTTLTEPTNYNGRALPRTGEFYFADYNGRRGLYKREDVEAHHMSNPKKFEI